MRNVVTLSDVPKDLYDWLRTEASRRTRLTGKKVAIYQVVVQAVREYREKAENHSHRRRSDIPTIELFRKELQPSELARRCLCVPKTEQSYFGTVGSTIAMKDALDGSALAVYLGSQYRLDLSNWYARHHEVKVGDEIVLEQSNGIISIKASPPRLMPIQPPQPGCCQVCGAKHEATEPHNRKSPYYQMQFHQEKGRWPTWEDAMAHCSKDVKKQYRYWLRFFVEKID